MRKFIRFFAERHTLANVFTFMILFLGVSTLGVIQRDNFPSVDFDVLTITTRYPGASPQDVEFNVTNLIEEQLKSVTDIKATLSYSMENISTIGVQLNPDAVDKCKAKNDIRDAVSRVTGLPAEVSDKPLVLELTTDSGIAMIEVGVVGDHPYKMLR